MSTQPERPPLMGNPDGSFTLRISGHLYAKEAVMAAAYRFTDRCSVKVGPADNDGIDVRFTLKAEYVREDIDALAAEFWNEVLDQQLRLDLDTRYGHLRDAVVEHAFKPLDAKRADGK